MGQNTLHGYHRNPRPLTCCYTHHAIREVSVYILSRFGYVVLDCVSYFVCYGLVGVVGS